MCMCVSYSICSVNALVPFSISIVTLVPPVGGARSPLKMHYVVVRPVIQHQQTRNKLLFVQIHQLQMFQMSHDHN